MERGNVRGSLRNRRWSLARISNYISLFSVSVINGLNSMLSEINSVGDPYDTRSFAKRLRMPLTQLSCSTYNAVKTWTWYMSNPYKTSQSFTCRTGWTIHITGKAQVVLTLFVKWKRQFILRTQYWSRGDSARFRCYEHGELWISQKWLESQLVNMQSARYVCQHYSLGKRGSGWCCTSGFSSTDRELGPPFTNMV